NTVTEGVKTGADVAPRIDSYYARTISFDANSSAASSTQTVAGMAVSFDSRPALAKADHTHPALALCGNGCRCAGCREGCRSFASSGVSGRRFCSQQRTGSYHSCHRPERLAQQTFPLALCWLLCYLLFHSNEPLFLTPSK